MHLLILILKIWLAVGAIPLLWDLKKLVKVNGLAALPMVLAYPVAGPLSWLFSLLVNFGNV